MIIKPNGEVGLIIEFMVAKRVVDSETGNPYASVQIEWFQDRPTLINTNVGFRRSYRVCGMCDFSLECRDFSQIEQWLMEQLPELKGSSHERA